MAEPKTVRPPGKFTESLLKEAAGERPVEGQQPDSADVAELVEGRCFGWYLVGQRQAIMLDLRQSTGERLALGYPYLVSASLPDASKLELTFTNCKVTVSGRSLLPIFQKLILHRIAYIQALGERYGLGVPDGETLVTAITVDELP